MESAPKYVQIEQESDAGEYVIDPSVYKHLSEKVAKQLALENGLQAEVIRREGQYLGEPVGHNPRRLIFTVLNGAVERVRIG